MKIAAIEVAPICYVDVVHAAPTAEVFTTAFAEIYDAAIVTAIPIKVGYLLTTLHSDHRIVVLDVEFDHLLICNNPTADMCKTSVIHLAVLKHLDLLTL